MLLSQLEEDKIKKLRSNTEAYTSLFSSYEEKDKLSTFKISENHELNHHAFWVIFDTKENAELFMAGLREKTIYAYIGYIPLHSAPKGLEYGYTVTYH